MRLDLELLEQSRMLATVDEGEPVQANLRRAISSAYYALFHLLVADTVELLVPVAPAALSSRVGRAFTHSDINKICGQFARQQLSDELRSLLPNGVPHDLQSVTATFPQLQQERHKADYDIGYATTRILALLMVEEAEAAFEAWGRVRASHEATVFMCALAFGSRWSK